MTITRLPPVTRKGLLVLTASLLLATACAPAVRKGTAPPVPTIGRPFSTTVPTTVAGPPGPAYLVLQKGHELFRMSLGDATGSLQKLFDVGDDAHVDPQGRYVAFAAVRVLSVRRLADGGEVAAVPAGVAIAFGADDTAVVSTRSAGERADQECLPPGALVSVDLRHGQQRALGAAAPGLAVRGTSEGVVAGDVRIGDCKVVAGILNLASGDLRRFGTESYITAVHPRLERIWVQLFPDGAHPNGSALIVDRQGNETARLGYFSYAAYSPDGNRVAYTQVLSGSSGVPSRGRVRLGGLDPAPSDPYVDLLNDGNVVWNVDGSGFALRVPAGEGFRAEWCSVPALACRLLPLAWNGFPAVTLLLVAPGRLVGAT